MVILLIIQMRIKCKVKEILLGNIHNIILTFREPQHSGVSHSRCEDKEDSCNQEAAHSDARNDDEK